MIRILFVVGTSLSLILTAPSDAPKVQPTPSTTTEASMPKPRVVYVPLATTTTTTMSPAELVEYARSVHGKCGEWYDEAMKAGWPPEEWKTISKVMYRESRCDPLAWNGQDAGLMQINKVHRKRLNYLGMAFPDSMFHGYWNLVFAHDLWQRAGWEPWKFRGVIPG